MHGAGVMTSFLSGRDSIWGNGGTAFIATPLSTAHNLHYRGATNRPLRRLQYPHFPTIQLLTLRPTVQDDKAADKAEKAGENIAFQTGNKGNQVPAASTGFPGDNVAQSRVGRLTRVSSLQQYYNNITSY